ncbi:hypothetical protein SKAU_G00103720 [Synaphobranchus kaupii]|uniref:Uncharacterized protein n=1 Tax=Synaphobranchus kaupii TaxID=118154 RepID=A0A9Q1FYQ7_SYNKA|nr:hypothetical protein SKAU_G00103720 [Synaphobranchus kaupii]
MLSPEEGCRRVTGLIVSPEPSDRGGSQERALTLAAGSSAALSNHSERAGLAAHSRSCPLLWASRGPPSDLGEGPRRVCHVRAASRANAFAARLRSGKCKRAVLCESGRAAGILMTLQTYPTASRSRSAARETPLPAGESAPRGRRDLKTWRRRAAVHNRGSNTRKPRAGNCRLRDN